MHIPPARPEHKWLANFVGEWTFESSCDMGPGQPPIKTTGTEIIRMIGDFWLVVEGNGPMPSGGQMTYLMLVGFDPDKGKFVGSWIGSPMTVMYVYEGALDASGTVLPLCCTGPNPMAPGTMANFQDVHELTRDGRRAMWSQIQKPDGTWQKFMHVTFQKRKG